MNDSPQVAYGFEVRFATYTPYDMQQLSIINGSTVTAQPDYTFVGSHSTHANVYTPSPGAVGIVMFLAIIAAIEIWVIHQLRR